MNLSERVRRLGCIWPAAGLAVGVAALLALAVLGTVTRNTRVLRHPATPALVRVAAPTATSTAVPTLPQPTPAPTAVSDGSGGETFRFGDLVEVYGTGGDGVRLRAEPGLQAAINGLGMDSEVFQVTDGPVESGGHVWWYLVNPYDTTRRGWAVAEFLRPLAGA